MVEGLRGRLVVEYDGDHWHGPEQFRADLHRQRVRGSTYTLDPEAALEDLWRTLDDQGVFTEGDSRNFALTPAPEVGTSKEDVPFEQADENGPLSQVRKPFRS